MWNHEKIAVSYPLRFPKDEGTLSKTFENAELKNLNNSMQGKLVRPSTYPLTLFQSQRNSSFQFGIMSYFSIYLLFLHFSFKVAGCRRAWTCSNSRDRRAWAAGYSQNRKRGCSTRKPKCSPGGSPAFSHSVFSICEYYVCILPQKLEYLHPAQPSLALRSCPKNEI